MDPASIIAAISTIASVVLAFFNWRIRRTAKIEKLKREADWNAIKDAVSRGDVDAVRRLHRKKPPA